MGRYGSIRTDAKLSKVRTFTIPDTFTIPNTRYFTPRCRCEITLSHTGWAAGLGRASAPHATTTDRFQASPTPASWPRRASLTLFGFGADRAAHLLARELSKRTWQRAFRYLLTFGMHPLRALAACVLQMRRQCPHAHSHQSVIYAPRCSADARAYHADTWYLQVSR